MTTLVVVCLLTLAALGFVILTLAVSRLKERIRTLEASDSMLEREFTAARARSSEIEAAQQFLARFVRELPTVVHGLLLSSAGRNIPKLLMGGVTRVIEPRRAIIAVRRRPAESDPDRHMRLAVAAVHPDDFLAIGTEIRIGAGEIGMAAEQQRVMDRRDFDNQPPHTRKRLREEAVGGFQPDLVAPMVVDQELVGIVAVEGLTRRASDMRDAFRLLAQVGAISMHTHSRYTEMKATANVDGLTGVFNKRYLTHRISDEIANALDEGRTLSVFLFDVDHFKAYNDQNGHVAGDRLLQSLAKLVGDNLRRDTVVGRYGGEEFLVIFPGLRREQAKAAAENIRNAIAAYPFPHGPAQPLGLVSISGGVAECPTDGQNAASLVRAADEALYRAKRAGRNRILAHEPVYLGGDALEPAPPSDTDPRTRAALEQRARMQPARTPPPAVEPFDTPPPGMLFSIAGITPPTGLPSLRRLHDPKALAEALEDASRNERRESQDGAAATDGEGEPKKPKGKDEAKSA